MDGVRVRIATAPVDGTANAKLCRFLAQVLGLRKSQVYLDKVESNSLHQYHKKLDLLWHKSEFSSTTRPKISKSQ